MIIVILTLSACSSVRTRSKTAKTEAARSKTALVSKKDTQGKSSAAGKSSANDRFSDTTVIYLQASPVKKSNNLVNQFEVASTEFDNEKFTSACPQFRLLSETFAKDDSLRYESLFFLSECLILENKLNPAQAILDDLYKNSLVPSSVMEKVIVRLGQLHCVSGKKQKATEMFNILRRRYPSSIYLPLANCDVIK